MTYIILGKQSCFEFGIRWMLPILCGAACGLVFVYFAMDLLVKTLGEIIGGVGSSLISIALAFGVTLALASVIRAIERTIRPTQNPTPKPEM
jgi:hypothetical protein